VAGRNRLFRLSLEPHADVSLTENAAAIPRARCWQFDCFRLFRDLIGDELAERTRGQRVGLDTSVSRRASKFGFATPARITAASWLYL
jgi:hypothetical protein